MKMNFKKKGNSDILGPTVIFIILNLLFFSMLLYFVYKQSTGAVVYEELYAKKIALLVDNARCNTDIIFDVSNFSDVLEKNNYELSRVFSLNSETSEVIVRVSEKGGYAQKYFSNCNLGFEIVGENLILKIGESRDE